MCIYWEPESGFETGTAKFYSKNKIEHYSWDTRYDVKTKIYGEKQEKKCIIPQSDRHWAFLRLVTIWL